MIKAAGIGLTQHDLGRPLTVLTPKLEELHRCTVLMSAVKAVNMRHCV